MTTDVRLAVRENRTVDSLVSLALRARAERNAIVSMVIPEAMPCPICGYQVRTEREMRWHLHDHWATVTGR